MLFGTQSPRLETPISCTWCPGCGNFSIWTAFKRAATHEGWDDSNTAIVAGIGCHGHIINFTNITAFEGLHGRAIPVASGIKMANHALNVMVFTGDGDCLAEGGNHFIHAARRNQNITVIMHDNALYGLTTGQTSPRSPKGYRSKSTPEGSIEEPLHPLRLALSAGATFLARCYAGDIPRLTELLIRANNHPGFSVLQVLQPCVTFNGLYTHQFYQNNTYELEKGYDKTDKTAAWKKLQQWGEKEIPVGVFYEVSEPTYEEQIPQIARKTLIEHSVTTRNIDSLFSHYR